MNEKKNLKVLVYRIGQLGDMLVSLPAMWAVREAFSEAHMTLLYDVHSDASYVTPKEVLPRDGLFNDYIDYSASIRGSGLFSAMWLLPKLRARQFHLLVYLAGRLRSPWQVRRDIRFFHMAGIPEVLLAEMDEPLPPKVPGHPLPRIERMTDYFLRRLTLSRISVSSIDVVRSGLRLTKEEIREARAFFDGKNLAYGPEQRVVGIGPGSKWASKRWPEERFREVGAQLMRDEACSIVVFGGPSDKEIGDRLVRQWGKGVNASGLLTVRESAAVLSLCNLYVGNDSGIIHLAAAVGVRCIGVYAAQDYPGMWEPYGSGHKIIRSQVECEGCHLPICTIEGMRCLKQIPIETVLYACHSMLLPNQDGLGRLYA